MMRENTISNRQKTLGKIARLLVQASLFALAILAVLHLVWKYSGSNKWTLEIDRDGKKVYSIKTPGTSLKHFKGTTRVRATLNTVVAAMLATDVEHCAEWIPGCSSERTVEPWSSQELALVHFYHVDYPSPFAPREFLLKEQVSQDPVSRATMVTFTAVPDKLPRNECCFRIAEMHNSWQFTPLKNGELEVEFVENFDQGMPYFLINQEMPDAVYDTLSLLPAYFSKTEWRNTKFDFIKEE
jgi:ribosome-associated toxin RatA of RatAB toxin-antitoxin module